MSQEEVPYWVFEWLESRGLDSISSLRDAVNKRETMIEIRDLAGQWAEAAGKPSLGLNLVAGSGIRLDDYITCPNPVCRRLQVDVLFRHAWHYFDRILLPDGIGDLLLNPPTQWSTQYRQDALLDLMEIALYVKQLGAIQLVQYYPPSRLMKGGPGGLAIVSNDGWAAAWSEVEAKLLANAEFQFRKIDDRKYVVILSDPLLAINSSFEIQLKRDAPENQKILRLEATRRNINLHIKYLESDLGAAQCLGGALASSVWSHEQVLSQLSQKPDIPSALFRVSFPTLQNVPIKELIAIRLGDGDAFLAFRSALTKVANELSSGAKGNGSPQDLADQIVREFVDPELARLRKRLISAQRALATKCTLSIGLASIGTLCGLQWAALPAAAAIAGINGAVSTYIEDNKTIEMSDMFFLWKALGHAK